MKISLRENQEVHFELINQILEEFGVALDMSDLGFGKTLIMIKTILTNKINKVIYVSRVNTIDNTLEEFGKYFKTVGIRKDKKNGDSYKVEISAKSGKEREYSGNQLLVLAAMSYESMAGKLSENDTNYTSSCFLKRTDVFRKYNSKGVPEYDTYYRATSEFLSYLRKGGIMLIFDECHAMKNSDSCCSKAGIELMNAVRNINDEKSGEKGFVQNLILMASGTPFVKLEEKLNYLSLLGICTPNNDFDRNSCRKADFIRNQLEETRQFCMGIDPRKTSDIVCGIHSESGARPGTIPYMQYVMSQLFDEIVQPSISSKGSKTLEDSEVESYNIYYKISEKEFEEYSKLVDDLEEELEVNGASIGNSQIIRILIDLEKIRIPTVIAAAKKTLEEDPNAHVIIGFWFLEAGEEFRKAFESYSPLYIDGSTPKEQRLPYSKKFREPSSESRVLICSIRTADTGLSFHDIYGGFKRYLYFSSPSWFYIAMAQMCGRVSRHGVKSVPRIIIPYFNTENIHNDGLLFRERKIYENMSRKASILAGAMTKTANGSYVKTILLPGEFVDVYE